MEDLKRCAANHPPLFPIRFIERAAIIYGDSTSVVYSSTRLTWSQTYQCCRRLASGLSAHVSVVAPNVYGRGCSQHASRCSNYGCSIQDGDPEFETRWPVDEWQSIIVNYTSGITSAPEGVVHGHRGIYTMVMDTLLTWGLRSQLKIEELGFSVTHGYGYGLTETAGAVVLCAGKSEWDRLPANERAQIKARQGIASLGLAELDVKDPGTMASVARDGVNLGEVMMRRPSIMKGYFNDERSTDKAMEGGWFHTGDVGVIHPDGYLEIKDRSKDVIISGGENISSVEVKSLLLRQLL